MNIATQKKRKTPARTSERPVPVTNLLYNHGNPYQRLIYADPKSGLRLVPGDKALLGRLGKMKAADRPSVLHLHWDDRLFGRGADQGENQRGADEMLDDLAQYQAKGGKLIWTVHNRAAHAERDAATFAEARRRIAGMADMIHVHAAHAAAHVAAEYDTPSERIRIIPHPSYLGAYEDAEATLMRPAAEGPVRFLHFGFIRTNKGSDSVVNAARALGRRDAAPWRLTIQGRAFRSGIRLMRVASTLEHVTASTDIATDEEVPSIFGAAHFYLAPVRELFTSGSLMLAQTYGLPILGPNTPEMRETIAPECHDLLYPDDGHPRRLLRAMIRAIEMDPAEREARRQACFAFAEARSPLKISRMLGSAIKDVL